MAARQIPSTEQGLRQAGTRDHGARRYFDRNSPANRNLRRKEFKRDGPVSVRVPLLRPASGRSNRMTSAQR
ncbi:hypothetical protein ABTH97_19985, partial [Acinetobacter baumannii]